MEHKKCTYIGVWMVPITNKANPQKNTNCVGDIAPTTMNTSVNQKEN